jgi:hypothetical protein
MTGGQYARNVQPLRLRTDSVCPSFQGKSEFQPVPAPETFRF